MSSRSLYLVKIIVFATSLLFAHLNVQATENLTAELQSGENLELHGIGIHEELRNDIYVGVLFAPKEVTSTSSITNPEIAKRMSIRLVTRYSNRKMSRHWKERLAMNNSRSKWQPLTKEIVQFSRIFKRGLIAGDEINIDYSPNNGTKIFLNGTQFVEVKNPEFFQLLLNVWLGTNPPTKAFKKSIRGEDNAETQQKFVDLFNTLQPQIGRFDADRDPVTRLASNRSSSSKVKSQQAKVAASQATTKKAVINKKPPVKTAAIKQEPSKKVATNNPPKKQNNSPKATVKNADTRLASNNTSSTNDQATKLSIKPELLKPELNIEQPIQLAQKTLEAGSEELDISPANEDNLNEQVEQIEKANQADSAAIEKVASLDLPQSPSIETIDDNFVDEDLLSGSYTRDLINTIRQHQTYPKKAQLRREEGDVLAKVTIDENGEVMDIVLLEKSGSRNLDRAVYKMIRKAAPFEAIPAELKLNEYEFEAPFSFVL